MTIRPDDRIRRELEAHLEALVRDGVARGLSPEQARRQARLAFGTVDLAAEECRDARPTAWLGDLWRDVTHGLRLLRRTPTVTAVAVVTLAVAIGATTAVFSLVHGLLLAPLPIDRPDRLVALSHDVASRGRGIAFPDAFMRELDAARPLVSGIAARGGYERVTLGVDGAGEPAIGELVSGTFFDVLGVKPAVGRLLTAADDAVRGAHPVVVLSHAFWLRRFSGDPAIVGRTITVSGIPMTVIGVSPAGFDGLDPGQRVDLRVPFAMISEVRGGVRTRSPQRPTTWELQLVARLADGATLASAQQALDAAFGRHARAAGVAGPARLQARAATTGYGRTRDRFGPALGVLMVLTLVVLAIAAVNVAMLVAGRAAMRQTEWAVRAALGAGWGRLLRQIAAESLLLAAIGTLLSPAIAWPGASWLAQLATGTGSNVLVEVRPNAPVVLGVQLLAGLLASLVIAAGSMARLRRARMAPTANSAARGVIAVGRHGLIAAQVALSVVVLAGATLFVRTIANLRAVDLGLRPDHLLLVALDPKTAGRADTEVAPFYRDLRERLLAIPGITGASYSTWRALANVAGSAPVTIEGRATTAPETALRNAVGTGYFAVLGTRIVAGREFGPADDRVAPKVAIVNAAFVRAYLGGRDPMGILIGQDTPEYRIVGVVGDVRHIHVREAAAPAWYIPYEQRPGLKHLDLVVRTTGDPERAIADVRAAVGAVDRRVALFEVRTQQAQIDELLVPEQILAQLATVFGVVATSLAGLGLYGLLSLFVSQRRRDLAVRLALGARPATLLGSVSRDIGQAIVAGLVGGLAAAAVLGRQAEALLFGVAPLDAVSLALAVGILIAAVAVGALPPLIRAARIDPVRALRDA
jgi:predicted permease